LKADQDESKVAGKGIGPSRTCRNAVLGADTTGENVIRESKYTCSSLARLF
jgi:hypothetical protein